MYLHMFNLPNSRFGDLLLAAQDAGERTWRHSEHICTFADNERHLGHLIKMEAWHAYDATRPDGTSGGFNYLGEFGDVATAMLAVEAAVARVHNSRTMQAGSAGYNQSS
jgi:hypothetical protein